MLGSSTVVSLTLLFSGISYASPDTNILPKGIDGTNGPRDLYDAAQLTGNLELVAEKREEHAALKKLPQEEEELEGACTPSLREYSTYTPFSSCCRPPSL